MQPFRVVNPRWAKTPVKVGNSSSINPTLVNVSRHSRMGVLVGDGVSDVKEVMEASVAEDLELGLLVAKAAEGRQHEDLEHERGPESRSSARPLWGSALGMR